MNNKGELTIIERLRDMYIKKEDMSDYIACFSDDELDELIDELDVSRLSVDIELSMALKRSRVFRLIEEATV